MLMVKHSSPGQAYIYAYQCVQVQTLCHIGSVVCRNLLGAECQGTVLPLQNNHPMARYTHKYPDTYSTFVLL